MPLYQKFRHLSKNHLILVLLCIVIGYLLRAHDTYVLRPVWRKRAEYHHFVNKKYPTTGEQLPAPIITDLDSDGVNEIVLVTNDLKLSVLVLPDTETRDEDDQTLPHVDVKHKVVLPQSINNSQSEPSGWPVVMVTGFTVPYMSIVQVRQQVIVIVTNTWWVYCYSSSLELLWQKQLLDFGEKFDDYYVKSMGALVTSHAVKKTDDGLILVGGSFAHKAHKVEEPQKQENVTETEPTAHEEHSTEDMKMTHFSTFALNGKDGSVRWHHLPGEFEETKKYEEPVEYHWKLSIKRHRLHIGESPWTFYKQELYKSLPHHWMTLKDTRFTLGRFQKSLEEVSFSDEDDETQPPTPSALDAKHMIGYAYGGHRPHSPIEHIPNPNAVVIHHQNGIEVLNILTGRPMTRLPLPDDGAVYTTLDKENDIKKLSWGEQENYSPCFLEIWRIFPIKENLERFPVCFAKRLFFVNNWVYDEDMFKKLPPLVIKSIARKSGVVRHLLGHHLRKETDQYDMIAFGSLGKITSLDKNGDFNWQSQVGAKWEAPATAVRKMKKEEWSELKNEFLNSFHPDRKRMSLQLFGELNCLVIVGWKDMSLIELTEGRVLAEHTVPCPPTGPLVVGDFNNDGMNDVIFTCKFGYIGFSLHRHTNHMYTALYAAAVFFTILCIAWVLSPEREVKTESDEEDSN